MAATVADIMDRDAPFVTLEAGVGIVTEAAHVIVEHGHNRPPVVEHGRHVGRVTRAGVLAALQQEG